MGHPPRRRCPGCERSDGESLGDKAGFALVRCGSCRTLYTAWLPEPEDAKDYSDYYSAGNLAERPLVRRRLDQLVSSLGAYRRTGRWLDVGCGAGTLMRAASAAGWHAEGTEVSEAAAQVLREQDLTIHVGDLSGLELPAAAYDVVSLVEVVEHVPDPGSTLARVAQLVRPGGAVYVTTPHGNGASARRLGLRWSVVAPPEHLQLFSVKGLRSACERAGLDVDRVRTHGVNPRELMARDRDQPFTTAERGRSSRELNEALSTSARGRLVKAVANGLLDLTRLGDGLKLTAERPR